MIPILYPSGETAFSANGIGMLSDVISCSVKEELNSKYELEMKYPVSGIRCSEIDYRTIILAKPDPITRPQPFRVYRMVPTSAGTVTVYARHLAYDLLGVPVSPFSANGVSGALLGLRSNTAVECPFTFSTDKTSGGTFHVKLPTPAWRCLGGQEGSVLDTFGGEYLFDRWEVRLQNRRGADRGVTIRYGKNLATLEQDKNCAEVYTGVYPFWTSPEGLTAELSPPIIQAEGDYDFTNILTLDCAEFFAEPPTGEQLAARARKYMADNKIGIPKVSWKIQFVDLDGMDEYRGYERLEQVLLGDSVSVIFPEMGVNASARVVAADYDPIAERYNSVTLGSVRSDLAKTLSHQAQLIQGKPSQSLVEAIAMTLTARILGARGGAVRLLDTDSDGLSDTLYVADSPDPNKAVKVWRWNYEGWAGSRTGYAGPYIFGATLEDGLLAEAVTAANLIAGTIKSADDGKTFFLDLDNGILKMDATELTIAGKSVDTLITDKMTQQEIFDALTNGGQTQGIHLQDGKIYINVEYLMAGELSADQITLNGLFQVRGNDSGASGATYLGGYIGYMSGNVEGIPTDGVAMYNANKSCYVIVTEAGVRVQAGQHDFYMVPNGDGMVIRGNLTVQGNISYAGELQPAAV